MGKARYLLNIVFLHLDVQIISFPNKSFIYKEYSLMGKIGSFKLQISCSSQDALDIIK
jgi:hypothetical protein